MDPRDTRHTRIVTWLKILLPMVALGLLSTIFLLSKPLDPGGEIPFADPSIADRADRQQVTGPRFSGVTEGGDVLTFRAESARPDTGAEGVLLASDLDAELSLADGSRVQLSAADAVLRTPDGTVELSGTVLVRTTTGYEVEAAGILTSYTDLTLTSLGPVAGKGPPGSFTAGGMRLEQDRESGDLQLRFTGGIKLLYDPQE